MDPETAVIVAAEAETEQAEAASDAAVEIATVNADAAVDIAEAQADAAVAIAEAEAEADAGVDEQWLSSQFDGLRAGLESLASSQARMADAIAALAAMNLSPSTPILPLAEPEPETVTIIEPETVEVTEAPAVEGDPPAVETSPAKKRIRRWM